MEVVMAAPSITLKAIIDNLSQWSVTGVTKSTNKVIFFRNEDDNTQIALKTFKGTSKGDAEHSHEVRSLSALSDSRYTVRHLHSVARGSAPKIPLALKRYFDREMWSGDFSYILFPMLGNGTLLDLLMKANVQSEYVPRRKLSLRLQRYLCRQVVGALIYLHIADGIAHGDLKADNIMITDDFRLALIDFGHSDKLKVIHKACIGTPAYRPLEIKEDESEFYSIERADLYTLGCTLFTIMF